jgi:hypothetical protein
MHSSLTPLRAAHGFGAERGLGGGTSVCFRGEAIALAVPGATGLGSAPAVSQVTTAHGNAYSPVCRVRWPPVPALLRRW